MPARVSRSRKQATTRTMERTEPKPSEASRLLNQLKTGAAALASSEISPQSPLFLQLQQAAESILKSLREKWPSERADLIRGAADMIQSITPSSSPSPSVLGTLYAPIGKLVRGTDQPVQLVLFADEKSSNSTQPDSCLIGKEVEEQVRHMLADINSDIRNRVEFLSLEGQPRVLASPITDEQLETLAEAVAFRTNDVLVISHVSPSIDEILRKIDG